MRGEQPILAFNRGMISPLALARVDLRRYPMAAQIQTNWMPRVLGSAMLRPGLQYLGSTYSDDKAKLIPFIFAADDVAWLELTSQQMRVWVDDEVVTRPSVSTAIDNSSFDTDLSNWAGIDQTGTTSQWVTGGYLGLTGYGGNSAGRRQSVSVGTSDRGTVHGLRVVVARGVIDVLVGSSAGSDDYFSVTLEEGTHSLAFTPTGNFWVQIVAFTEYESLVSSCSIDTAGDLVLPTPWTEADLGMVRFDQSGDVVFVACDGYQQRKIERRGPTSWSVVTYLSETGPFRAINTSGTTISNTNIRATTVLTASQPLFRSDHVGALFRLDSGGQDVRRSFTALDDEGDKIVVTGVGDARDVTVTATFDGGDTMTLTLQRSVGDTGVWEDTTNTYAATTSTTFNDALDNQIVAYRLKCTAFTSGSVPASLRYAYGSIVGVVRITEVTNSTTATAIVLKTLGNLGTGGNSATLNWYEGAWSEYRGWPSAVALYEGRLWWAGKDKWYGSVTDDFANFDPDHEGDAGPIQRSIGSGPVDTINWLLPLQRLMAGTDGSVVAGRSSSLDEPLTPTNFNPKPAITQGSARVQAQKIDDTGVFVQVGGRRVFSMAPSVELNASYGVEDLTQLAPEVTESGIVAIAIQRKPDTRIHCVRTDGKVAVMIYDKTEDVKCWVLVETDGAVEDAIVLPGSDGEDAVYYVVRRGVDGATVRYVERWAREDECVGGTTCKLQDSFVVYDGSNLTHLEGESVVGWYQGVAYGPTTVSGGAAASFPPGATVGLTYEASFQSTKLAFLAQPGESGLPAKKRVHSLALLLADTHPLGITFGQDFDTMDNLPGMEAYAEVDQDAVWDHYNYEAITMPGSWTVDARLCLKAAAPYPCTILGAVVGMNSNSTT